MKSRSAFGARRLRPLTAAHRSSDPPTSAIAPWSNVWQHGGADLAGRRNRPGGDTRVGPLWESQSSRDTFILVSGDNSVIQPARFLAFAFYQLTSLFKAMGDDGLSTFKALVVILFAEMCLVIDVDCIASIIIGRLLLPSSKQTMTVILVAILFATSSANYRWLVKNDNWARFKEEFDSYPIRKRIIGQAAIAGFVTLPFAGLLLLGSITRKLPHLA